MSPSEVGLGALIILGVLVVIIAFTSVNTRHHTPDDDELNLSHEEDVHPDSLDR
jgi:hypothetical protein